MGILSTEDSKCEGFLDVCCLDPDFSAPPPSPIKQYTPKCGQRHQNGLGVRIQGFKDGESQFGEWPHMCAVLSEEPISEGDSGYTQQQEMEDTVNLYQCGGSLIAPDTILTAAHCVDKFRENPGSLKTGDLGDNLEIVSDIFGDVSGITHSGVQPGNVADVEVVVEVVRNEDGYMAPDDYDSRPGDLIDKATTTVDQVFQNCEDYADQGYDCVPYYQCHNGSIITDGGGLIDIRNGFGILSPEDSKCEGFLDVCCLDPDFEAPPPTPIKQYTLTGRKKVKALTEGTRAQNFLQYLSQCSV